MTRCAAGGLVVLVLAGSCAADRGAELVEILERERSAIMAAPGVTGVGIGRCDDAPCIKVFALERRAALTALLEDRLAGARYQIVVTEPFEARPGSEGEEP